MPMVLMGIHRFRQPLARERASKGLSERTDTASKGLSEAVNAREKQDLAIRGLQFAGGLWRFLQKASLDSDSFSACTELCGCTGDELYVLAEYRDHLMSVQSRAQIRKASPVKVVI